MVAFLLEEVGLTLNDLDKFYVAGAFGVHLDIESAVTIGMYPDLPREKFECPGNSSLKGAYKLLTDRNLLSDKLYRLRRCKGFYRKNESC